HADIGNTLRVVAVNYESAIQSVVAKRLLSIGWGAVFLDESHRAKNPTAITSKLAHRLSMMSRVRVLLTGTPMPHSPLDIFSQFLFANPSIFGRSFTLFRARYAEMGVVIPPEFTPEQRTKLQSLGNDRMVHAVRLLTTKEFKSDFRKSIADQIRKWLASPTAGGDPLTPRQWMSLGKVDAKQLLQVVGWKNQEELRSKIARITYQVATKDVIDLPEFEHQQRVVELEPKAMEVYRKMEDEFVVWFDENRAASAANVLVKLLRLMQITSGFLATFNASEDPEDDPEQVVEQVSTAKIDALRDICEGIDPGEPIVVFCLFRHDLDAIAAVAKDLGRQSFELSGRRDELAGWQSDVGGSIIAVQTQSGGVGISLVRARYCVY
ncbi:MAG: hypothetical protein EBZ77_17150, partial [Chitinophagia bacterium]|nr:hypothetical protein [Chitinophagia bacterium]